MDNLKHLATFAAGAKAQLFHNMATLNEMAKVKDPTQEDLDKAEALTGKVAAMDAQMKNFADEQGKRQAASARVTEDLGLIPKGTSKLDKNSAAPLLKMLLETLEKMPKDAVDEISDADLTNIENHKHEEARKQMRVNVGADGQMTH